MHATLVHLAEHEIGCLSHFSASTKRVSCFPVMAVFVNGFDFDTPESTLHSHFSSVGSIKDVRFLGKGSAVVEYDSIDDAEQAVEELNNSTMEGNRRYVTVRLDGKGKGKGKENGKGKDYGKGKDNGKYGKGQEIGKGRSDKGKSSKSQDRDGKVRCHFARLRQFETPLCSVVPEFATNARRESLRKRSPTQAARQHNRGARLLRRRVAERNRGQVHG